MDYLSAVDSIRDERMDLVESLADLQQQLKDTLSHFVSTGSLPPLQNLRTAFQNYIAVRDDIEAMIHCLDVLEDDLMEVIRHQGN